MANDMNIRFLGVLPAILPASCLLAVGRKAPADSVAKIVTRTLQ